MEFAEISSSGFLAKSTTKSGGFNAKGGGLSVSRALTLSALGLCLLVSHSSLSAAKPNLLLFLADDMTWTDLGCFGHPEVQTPNLDKLAEQGLRLTKCYTAAPTCSPLRQSLYTGIYPVRNGAHPNHSQVYPRIKSLPHYLRPLGYRVAIVGKRHEAPAESFPFEYLGGSHGDGGKTPDGADLPLAKAKSFMTRDADQPWCLVVASNQPHSPWNRGDASKYPASELTVPKYLVDTPQLRSGLSKYYAEISYMDGQVGQLTTWLTKVGQDTNTVVLWLSEQGSELPFCKWTCYDTGIHAAAVVRWPGVVQPGSTNDALISYVDVVPTFLELAGGNPSRVDVDGESFAGVLRGEKSTHHDFVFSVNTTRGIYHGSEAYAIRSVTDGRWLYIRNLHFESQFQNIATERFPIFTSWKRVGSKFARSRVQAYQSRPAEELFDLSKDPYCLQNLADEEDLAELKSRLRRQLDRWMRQQGDEGDQTERNAEQRQPKQRPWAKNGIYAQQVR